MPSSAYVRQQVTEARAMSRALLWQIISGTHLDAPKPTDAIWLETLRRGTLRKKNRSRISSEQMGGLERMISRVLKGEFPDADQATVGEARRLEMRISSIPLTEGAPWPPVLRFVDLGEQKSAPAQRED